MMKYSNVALHGILVARGLHEISNEMKLWSITLEEKLPLSIYKDFLAGHNLLNQTNNMLREFNGY